MSGTEWPLVNISHLSNYLGNSEQISSSPHAFLTSLLILFLSMTIFPKKNKSSSANPSGREPQTDRQSSEVGRLITGCLPRSDFDRGHVTMGRETGPPPARKGRAGGGGMFSFCAVFLGAESGLVSLGASYYSSLRNSASSGGHSPSDGIGHGL